MLSCHLFCFLCNNKQTNGFFKPPFFMRVAINPNFAGYYILKPSNGRKRQKQETLET